MATIDAVASDRLKIEQTDVPTRGVGAAVTDTIGIEPALTAFYGLVVLERLRLSLTDRLNQIGLVNLAEGLRLTDSFRHAFPMVLTETIGIEPTLGDWLALTVAETLRLRPALTVNASLQVTLLQALRLTDRLRQFFGADVTESIELAPAIATQLRSYGDLEETIGIELAATPQFLLNVKLADAIDISATDALQMFYNAQLVDGIELSAGFLEPNGSFTTWAMNARSGAVTEYTDYAFNSFARMGDRYLGASDDGLYELLGDTDDGDPIIPRVRSGFMQFGGPQLSRLKAAYIAARGAGDYVLRIETGEGLVYSYAASTHSMHTTKIDMGKGQRARYFAFELIGDGSDFDLDTLEFVPIVMQRRV